MKRVLVMLCVVGMMAAIPLCDVATAAKKAKEPKVEICHVNSANDVIDLGYLTLVFGRVIEVPASAVEAHLAHGDSDWFFPLSPELREDFEDDYGVYLRNANAFFVVPNL